MIIKQIGALCIAFMLGVLVASNIGEVAASSTVLPTAASDKILEIPAIVVGQAGNGQEMQGLTPLSDEIEPRSVVCHLNNNANLYTWVYRREGSVDFLYKASKGRGFRVYAYLTDGRNRIWMFGHSAQKPKVNGWVLAKRLDC